MSAGPLLAHDLLGPVIQVSPIRHPALFGALHRGMLAWHKEREKWRRVVELRAAGKHDTANRVARRLMGVKGPPMPEEVKELLRSRAEERRALKVGR